MSQKRTACVTDVNENSSSWEAIVCKYEGIYEGESICKCKSRKSSLSLFLLSLFLGLVQKYLCSYFEICLRCSALKQWPLSAFKPICMFLRHFCNHLAP